MNAFAYRWLGFIECNRRDGLRFTWLQLIPGWGLAADVSVTGDDPYWFSVHLSLVWGHVYLALPIRYRGVMEYGTLGLAWGGTWAFNDAWHLHWGHRTKIIHMPWRWCWVRSSELLFNGEWFTDYATAWLDKDDPHGLSVGETIRQLPEAQRQRVYDLLDRAKRIRWTQALPYEYRLRSGAIQQRTATIGVRIMEWRRWWTFWLRWGAKIRRTIEVEFDQEIGERAGTWKGGVVGCSYEMRPGETAKQCLRRMERDRKL